MQLTFVAWTQSHQHGHVMPTRDKFLKNIHDACMTRSEHVLNTDTASCKGCPCYIASYTLDYHLLKT